MKQVYTYMYIYIYIYIYTYIERERKIPALLRGLWRRPGRPARWGARRRSHPHTSASRENETIIETKYACDELLRYHNTLLSAGPPALPSTDICEPKPPSILYIYIYIYV